MNFSRTVVLSAALVCGFAAVEARALDPHVEAVVKAVESARGRVERTADGQGLTLVDLAVPGAGPHDHREADPYDAAFFEHLGHVSTLESLNIISTKFHDDWMPHIARLTRLKSLRFTNNGKLTDAGMEQLAGLKELEQFSFVGTRMTGKAYAKFTGFDKLVRVSHRGSSIDDAGLKELCDHLPNLESLSLAHAKFTDAGAVHLAKLTRLKGLEIGAAQATPQALVHLAELPLEYLQLGEGFDSAASLPRIAGIATLRRLTLTDAARLTDADVRSIAALAQLENLELGKLPLPAERVPVLKDFARLKALRLVPGKTPFTAETEAAVRALLPNVELKFK